MHSSTVPARPPHLRALTKPAPAVGMVHQGLFLTVLELALNFVLSRAQATKGDKEIPGLE